MNDLLISEISSNQTDLLKAIMLVEEHIFGQQSYSLSDIELLVSACENEIAEIDDPLEQAEHLINFIFLELLFLDKNRKTWPAIAFQLKASVEHRLISPALKAALICYIFQQCGFSADLVFVPEKIMVRLVCDEQYAIIFEPVTGESLSWFEFDERMEEVSGDPMMVTLDSMDTHAVILDYLTACKNALILEGQFDRALKCVDVLLAMRPDDPFERRDRGFLLHQLDCFKVAYDDYQYFVEQCPKDPAAQLLKIQLDKITINETILH